MGEDITGDGSSPTTQIANRKNGTNMTELFRALHHVCVVVHDLEKSLAYYQRIGFDGWFDYPKGTAYEEFNVPDVAASKVMKYKCCDLDNFQLQLCQPGPEDSPQRRHLDTYGESVYHLGFEVDDLLGSKADGEKSGMAVIANGHRSDGTGFCYFDTKADAGVVLEIRKTQQL